MILLITEEVYDATPRRAWPRSTSSNIVTADRYLRPDFPGAVTRALRTTARFLRRRRAAVNRLIRAVIDTHALPAQPAHNRERARGAGESMAVVQGQCLRAWAHPTALALAEADASRSRGRKGWLSGSGNHAADRSSWKGCSRPGASVGSARHGFDRSWHDPLHLCSNTRGGPLLDLDQIDTAESPRLQDRRNFPNALAASSGCSRRRWKSGC